SDLLRSEVTGFNLGPAFAGAGGKRQAATNDRRAVYGPAADQQISGSAHATGILLALAERQVGHPRKDEQMVPVIIVGAIRDSSVDVVVAAVVVIGALVCVIR